MKTKITKEMQTCEHEGELGCCCLKCGLPSSLEIGEFGWDVECFGDDEVEEFDA